MKVHPGNVITFSVGLLIIAGGLHTWSSLSALIERAEEIPATVVELVHESVTKKGRIHPVVRFLTRDGREIVVTSQQHLNVQRGQTVQVLYDAAHPDEIEIGTIERVKHRRVVLAGIAIAIGLVVCTLGVGLDANTLEWRFRRRPQG